MSPDEIQMCVADALRDDDIENLESILRMLNYPEEPSWRVSRGAMFTEEEVRTALEHLIAIGLVTACAEQYPSGECNPISVRLVGTEYPWAALWFHLEPAGRETVSHWWQTEGEAKYPDSV